MSFRLNSIRVYVGYELAAALSAVLILDREDRYICCFAAAAAHELGHLLMMRLFKVGVRGISLRLFDVLIEADSPRGYLADICVTLGGPAVNLILAGVCMPLGGFFWQANLALGCFNLLPVESLDGGRFISLTLTRLFTERAARIALNVTSFVILLPLMTAGIYTVLRSEYNYSLLMISLYLLAILFLKGRRGTGVGYVS